MERVINHQMDRSKLQSIQSNSRKVINKNGTLILLTEPPAIPKNTSKLLENARIIDLSDKNMKMALHRQFKIDEMFRETEHSRGELGYCIGMTDKTGEEFFVPKLPPGTILVKQDFNKLKKLSEDSVNSMRKRLNYVVDSQKPNSLVQPEKNRNSMIKKNPSRLSKKKIDEDFPRPRLLTLKRRGNDANLSDKKKLKLSDVPYMNTRSVTKRLYNVGATLQVPSIRDEIEWREWPVHGMHERPVYHPQMGLGVEFIGRCFASFDDRSYQEISNNSEINFPPLNPLAHYQQQAPEQVYGELSFGDCMHSSLHSVLSYAAQLTTPECKTIDEKIAYMSSKNSSKACIEFEVQNSSGCRNESPKVNETKSPSSGTPSETPMSKLIKPTMNLQCIKNHAKLQQALGRGKKNTLILLKSSEPPLNRENTHLTSENEKTDSKIKSRNFGEERHQLITRSEKINVEAGREKTEQEKNLKELIGDTAVLYCTAMGIYQDDLINYLDSLFPNECISWMSTPC